jgi:hypothetical protein
MHHHKMSVRATFLVAISLSLVSGCASDAPTKPQVLDPIQPRATSAELQSAVSRLDVRSGTARQRFHAIAREAKRNKGAWFGQPGQRTRLGKCEGISALMQRALRESDAAKGQARSDAERARVVMQVLSSGNCASKLAPMSVFPTPGALAPSAAPTSAIDEAQEFVAQNLRNAVMNAINGYATQVGQYAPASHTSYLGGLTALEQEMFLSVASELDASIAAYGEIDRGGGDGSDSGYGVLSLFRLEPNWKTYVSAGCAGGVGSGLGDIIEGAVAGYRWRGWIGAALGAAGVAAERCALGALGGYLAYLAEK